MFSGWAVSTWSVIRADGGVLEVMVKTPALSGLGRAVMEWGSQKEILCPLMPVPAWSRPHHWP